MSDNYRDKGTVLEDKPLPKKWVRRDWTNDHYGYVNGWWLMATCVLLAIPVSVLGILCFMFVEWTWLHQMPRATALSCLLTLVWLLVSFKRVEVKD